MNQQDRLSALSPKHRELLEILKKRERRSVSVPTHVFSTPQSSSEASSSRLTLLQEKLTSNKHKKLDFSLFFFSADSTDRVKGKYDEILQISQFADKSGFTAIWNPERHFYRFGGLYPNPSVLSAAIAMKTERIEIRSGSVVLPLHHPIRVAEEWSVVDNLSGGRVGLSFASGWHPDDFVLSPENYVQRKETMFERIEVLKHLWQGEKIAFQGHGGNKVVIGIQPLPVRQDLQIWVSSSGNPETWERAGIAGTNVLTALLSQSTEMLKGNIEIYRKARALNGHDPDAGIVTVMLHTFIGDDMQSVRETVREPFIQYLQLHMELYGSQTISKDIHIDPQQFTEEDRMALARFAFERYFTTSALMGTPESCEEMLDRLVSIGVNEIACLIDFGVPNEALMESLERLDMLRVHYMDRAEAKKKLE